MAPPSNRWKNDARPSLEDQRSNNNYKGERRKKKKERKTGRKKNIQQNTDSYRRLTPTKAFELSHMKASRLQTTIHKQR